MIRSRRRILGFSLLGIAVIAMAAWMWLAAGTQRVSLAPGETPLEDVFDLFRKGDRAAAWTALHNTGVKRSLGGSSYESLHVSERRVAWMLPGRRRLLFMEATDMVNDFKTFLNGIDIDLDVANVAADAAELERRRQSLRELGAELSRPDRLMIYQMTGQWISTTEAATGQPSTLATDQNQSTEAVEPRPPRPADLVTP